MAKRKTLRDALTAHGSFSELTGDRVTKREKENTGKYLREASHVGKRNYTGMIEWLEKAGHVGVNVPGNPAVPFKRALEEGYKNEIYSMFRGEIRYFRDYLKTLEEEH